MAGHVRYESSSVGTEELGFTGNYPNGQRGNYTSASLDRSGSFREGSENRVLGSGASMLRASASGEVPSLTHCLLLDPITMGDQKYTRSGELRRVLGISLGNAAEDNSFGAAHSKPPPPVATEELKRFKSSVLDASSKARVRIKRLNESLLKLNKYCEAFNFKKQNQNEMLLMSERSGGSNFMKMGIQIHRNSADLGTQDRPKNIVLNKRVRSSVAELRADGRSSTLPRQPLIIGKDRDTLRDGGEGSEHLPEEKVRRMPAGGEGWDKKMKRKRSVGSVFARSTDSEGEVKRVVHHKFNNEPSLQTYDVQSFSTGGLSGTNGANKLDGSSPSASSNLRSFPKNEHEKVSFTRDFADSINKERLMAKTNTKLNTLEDNHSVGPSPVTKGKASRAHRTASVMAANSSNFSRSSGAPDGWEQTSTISKLNPISGPNNRKRTMSAGSSSPPMAQWVGQRPQKISRTRRANVVSPVSNHDEVQSEVGHASEFATRLSNGSPLAKDVAIGNQLVRVKNETGPSPARLSESEESGAGACHEGRPMEKGTGVGVVEDRSQNLSVGPSVVLTKKNKILNKEDTGDGLRRQGRIGRVGSSSRASISPVREKFENLASSKPVRSAKPASDKNGSKTGRPPLKKISDRKTFARGQTTCGSPDFTGESDDDREELLAAANFACNASYFSCSNSFWKTMEPVFATVCLEDISYLKHQIKFAEELQKSSFEISGHDNITSVDIHQENFQSKLISEESGKSFQDHIWPKRLTTVNLADQCLENDESCGNLETNRITPLYQRVLSALIVEDESEEFEDNCTGINIPFQNNRDRLPGASSLHIDFETRSKDRIEFDYDSILGFQTQKQYLSDVFSCNGNATIHGTAGSHNQLYNDEFFKGGQEFVNSTIGTSPGHSGNNGEKLVQSNSFHVSAWECQYDQICLEEKLLMEFQSIGLFPESVPGLADGEDEAINQDIIELQKGLHQQTGKKKTHLDKIIKSFKKEKEVERAALEQVAMNRLVELAYKKLLATKGSFASKYGVPKVSKQVALAFMKRTLARCRKFEDTGKSCFGEPALQEIINGAPLHRNQTESTGSIGSAVKTGLFPSKSENNDLQNDKSGRAASHSYVHERDFAKTGPLLNRGKKKELLLDDVGGNASSRATPSLGNTLIAGTKGKRSERERDKDALAKNPVAKAGRASQSSAKGDRKAKSKPKQRTAQLSTTGDGISNKFKDTSNSNRKRDGSLNSYGYNSQRGATEIAELQDLSLELGIANDMDSHQDLSNLFNFDEDGLPENDLIGLDLPMDGLEIPMDDLSELNMLL